MMTSFVLFFLRENKITYLNYTQLGPRTRLHKLLGKIYACNKKKIKMKTVIDEWKGTTSDLYIYMYKKNNLKDNRVCVIDR